MCLRAGDTTNYSEIHNKQKHEVYSSDVSDVIITNKWNKYLKLLEALPTRSKFSVVAQSTATMNITNIIIIIMIVTVLVVVVVISTYCSSNVFTNVSMHRQSSNSSPQQNIRETLSESYAHIDLFTILRVRQLQNWSITRSLYSEVTVERRMAKT